MPKLSRAQVIYIATLGTALLMCIGLQLAAPIMEYLYGRSKETLLLSHLASVAWFVFVGLAVFVGVLQRIGVLPSVQGVSGNVYQPAAFKLKYLAFWIVVALLLVFLFNLFQGSGGNSKHAVANVSAQQMPPLVSMFVNVFPMILLIGVWIFFMYRMSAKKKKDLDTGG